MASIPELHEKAERLFGELDSLKNTFGANRETWPQGQRERAERIEAGIRRTATEVEYLETADKRREQIRAAIADPANRTNGFGGMVYDAPQRHRDPWSGLDGQAARAISGDEYVSRAHDVLEWTPGLSDRAREILADTIDSRDGGIASAFVVSRSNPAYLTGFEKLLANPERAWHTFTAAESAAFAAVESIRATLTTNTGTGGYTIPLALDPQLAALANAGVANPYRDNASVVQTISSPYRGLTSAGITMEWTSEGAAFGDDTPTFGKVDIPLYKLTGFVAASLEVLGDAGSTIVGTLPRLLADARNRAEGTVFATGDGTTQPKGLVTALSAASAFVTATTRGSFTTASGVDIFALWSALPARARQSASVAFVGNVAQWNVIRQMGSSAPAALYTVDFTTGSIPRLLGAHALESSAMSAATTSGTNMLAAVDLAAYRIADHAAGPILEYIPVLFDQTTARPNGTRGWMYAARVGADLLDTTQGKLLKS